MMTVRIVKRIRPSPQVDNRLLSSACAALLASKSPTARVLTVPMSDGFEVHYKTRLPCFFPLPLDESARDVILRYPIPAMDLDRMQSRFGVTHLLTCADIEKREPEVSAAVAPLTPTFDNGGYRVYALPSRKPFGDGQRDDELPTRVTEM
jgi:hypothetical protein